MNKVSDSMFGGLFAGFGGLFGIVMAFIVMMGVLGLLLVGGCVGCAMLVGNVGEEMAKDAELRKQKALANETVTVANYEKLEDGMSLEEVNEILGKKGTLSYDVNGVSKYTWNTDPAISLFANISCEFKDRKLSSKSCSGLE